MKHLILKTIFAKVGNLTTLLLSENGNSKYFGELNDMKSVDSMNKYFVLSLILILITLVFLIINKVFKNK